MTKDYCHSFKPMINRRSRVLILGSMPGPEALRKQQFYGFEGNHFWTIVPWLFGKTKPPLYKDRIALVRQNQIALWDVIESCTRPGALDSAIRNPIPNKIPQLIKKYPNIRAIFINGQTAYKLFMKAFGQSIDRPVHLLPSTSPAHAAMPLEEKKKRWGAILSYLDLERPKN